MASCAEWVGWWDTPLHHRAEAVERRRRSKGVTGCTCHGGRIRHKKLKFMHSKSDSLTTTACTIAPTDAHLSPAAAAHSPGPQVGSPDFQAGDCPRCTSAQRRLLSCLGPCPSSCLSSHCTCGRQVDDTRGHGEMEGEWQHALHHSQLRTAAVWLHQLATIGNGLCSI